MWLMAAVGSALFAGLTSILAKQGIRRTDPDVATLLRTGVVLVFSWVMALLSGSLGSLGSIAPRSLAFLGLSGLATGASWLCYFKALSLGDVSRVVPVDKTSTVLSVLLAMALFGETAHLALRLGCTALIGGGIWLMAARRAGGGAGRGPWLLYALLGAVFAALTSALAKIGITGVESNLGTALRTVVVLGMAALVVALRGKGSALRAVDRGELRMILLSGLATGLSWLCYYYAIQNGAVSVVVPVDKLSVAVSVVFSRFALGERLSRQDWLGLGLMTLGTVGMALASV